MSEENKKNESAASNLQTHITTSDKNIVSENTSDANENLTPLERMLKGVYSPKSTYGSKADKKKFVSDNLGNKPNENAFIRTNVKLCGECYAAKMKAAQGFGDKHYIIANHLVDDLKEKVKLSPKIAFYYIEDNGNTGFWLLADANGKYAESARECLKLGIEKWVRPVLNMEHMIFSAYVPQDQAFLDDNVLKWPEGDFMELVRERFGDQFIDDTTSISYQMLVKEGNKDNAK